MADGHFPGLVSKDRNVNAITNPIYVQLADGTVVFPSGGGVEATALRVTIANDSTGVLSIDDNGGSITVDGTVAISGSVTVTATNLDIRDLTHVSDSVQVGDGTTTADVLDGTIDALYTAITDGTEALSINTDGSINVNVVSAVSANELHSYDTSSAVASDATDNHDYTATGGTFLLTSVIFACSGQIKAEIIKDPAGTPVPIATGFTEGKQGDTKQLFFDPAVEVATGLVLRLARTNRSGSAQDVYSTIIGRQL